MSKLECLFVAVVLLAGLVIGLIVWQSGAGNVDLSAWARWFMTPGNDVAGLVEYYLRGGW